MRRFLHVAGGLCALPWLLAVAGDDPASDGFQVLDSIRLADAAPVSNHAILVVTGMNRSSHPLLLGINVFEGSARRYADRVTIERKVLPGPFRLEVPRGGLRRNDGRALPGSAQHRATVFARAQDRSVLTARIHAAERPGPPEGTIALDFGRIDGPAASGFDPVAPGNPRLTCDGTCRALERDPFLPALGDGITGILGIRIPVPPGTYTLRLWTRDRGAWEYLPHHREQRIKINGTIAHYTRRTPRQWVRDVYLAGRDRDAVSAKSLWDQLQGQRTDTLTFSVAAPEGLVEIAFAGNHTAATHVAALALVPDTQGSDVSQLEAPMREVLESQWPITRPVPVRETTSLSATLTAPASRPLTRGGVIHVMAEILVPADTSDLAVTVTALPVWVRHEIWVADWALRRPTPGAHWLTATDRKMRLYIGPVPAQASVPKRVLIRLKASGTPREPQQHTAKLVIRAGQRRVDMPIVFGSSPRTLAPREVRVGAYLEDWPVTEWFRHDADAPERIAPCVARILSDFGLTAIGLPASPRGIDPPQRMARMIEDYATTFTGGVMAYAQLKRSQDVVGNARTATVLETVLASLSPSTRTATYWSIADEPTASEIAGLRRWHADLSAIAPGALLVGHLNRPDVMPHAALFDRVFLNHGPGPLARSTAGLRDRRIAYWLYNLPSPRLGAGLAAWATQAEGYFQWHAMMPTADPYDPTDGREDDVFLVYPEQGTCGRSPTIDQSLLELEAGIWDLAWLRALARETAPAIKTRLRRLETRARSWPASRDPRPLIETLDEIIAAATQRRETSQ